MLPRNEYPQLHRPAPARSPMILLRSWLLMLPMVFLVVHGQPSFMQGGRNVEGGTGLASAAEAASDGADSALERVFVYTAYGIVVGACIFSAGRMRRVLPFAAPLMWLAGLALCSVIWSQVPINSLRYAVYYTLDTLLAIYLLAAYSLEEIMSLVMMTGVLVGICSVVTVILFPQYGIVHLADHAGVWQGIFSEKNDAAKNMMFLLTPVFGRQLVQWKNMVYVALMLPLIFMTGSKSAMVALFIMLLFVCMQSLFAKLTQGTARFGLIAIVLLSATCGALLFVAGPRIAALLGRDVTLTGRTDIWSLLLESAMRRPWLGYGYSAFWTGLDGESGRVYETLHWIFTYAHNGLLEVWLQVGILGVALVLYALVSAVRNAWIVGGQDKSPGARWLICVLVLTLLYNLDEGTILFTRAFVSMLFVLTCTGLAKEARRLTERSESYFIAPRPDFVERMAHA